MFTPESERLSPYQGLSPYYEKDASFFFGRDKETRLIIANLFATSLTLLYGASGVGKSSVLRAGVAHNLRKRNNLVVVSFDSWQSDPVGDLKNAISKAAANAEGREIPLPSSAPLAEFLAACSRRVERHLMVILDQFEEYFLYRDHDDTFGDQFPKAVMSTESPVSFLLSIREDCLAKLDRFEGRVPTLFDNYLRIEHLDPEAARAAIEEPLKQFSILHRTTYEPGPGLVEEVLKEVKIGQVILGEGGRGVGALEAAEVRIEAPYLQLVMTHLWEKELASGSTILRRETLDALGGAKQIIRRHLDELMNALSPDKQYVAASLFHYLVTPGGTKIAHTASDLAQYGKFEEEQVQPILDKLSEQEVRILRSIAPSLDQPTKSRYEIFHDALAPAILDWRARFVQAQEEAQAREILVREQREAEQRYRRVMERARRARARARLYLVAVVVLSTLLVVIVGLLFYAFHQRRVATQAQADAEEQRLRVQVLYGLVKINERSSSLLEAILRGHTGAVNSAVFSADGGSIVTASLDGTARVWDISTEQNIELAGHGGAVNNAAFSPDGKSVVTASVDGTARVWDVGTRKSTELRGHTGGVNTAEFSPDGTRVVTASVDGTARIWDVSAEQSIELRGHTGAVNTAVFSPDGRFVVTASVDGTARLWDAGTGHSIVFLRGHKNVINSAMFSRDGRFVVTASADRTARVWDATTGERLAELTGHTGAVNSAAFSASGEFVVTASDDGTARISEPGTGRVVTLSGHTERVINAVFSPDDQMVITASEDKTARVWEANTGRSIAELRGHTSRVNTVVLSRDGRLALTASGDSTASGDTTARIWMVPELRGFRVSKAFLEIDPEDYTGPCPATIRLLGSLSVVGGAGTVKYRFVRTNGKPGKENELTFSSPGTKEVNTTWSFGGPAYPEVTGSFYIQVTAPQQVRSNETIFEVHCEFPSEEEPQGLNAPDGLSALKVSSGKDRAEIELKWLPVPGATSYKLEIKGQQQQPFDNVLKVTPDVQGSLEQFRISVYPQIIQWRVWPLDGAGKEGRKSTWRSLNAK